MNLPNGHLLQKGKYKLTQVVGQGGFGITYKGDWSTELKGVLGTIRTDVPVCVKEYFFKDYCYRDSGSLAVRVHSATGNSLFDKFKEKLIKEAKILSEVHHPHIVNVLEVFEENNTAYIAMEYISGYSLKQRMEREGCFSEAKVLRYIRQIGEALQFVHEKNILHLDIKPSNILIDKDDNARLIDFGVSKRYDIEQQETSTTILTLSKGFASIEQYDNEGTQNFSPCPDIYSLGATLYNLLTGKIPTESILRATRPLQKPTEINPVISAKTEAAILKAMQIIPSDRFQSVTEMLAALDIPLEESARNNPVTSIPMDSPVASSREETTVLQFAGHSPSLPNDDEQTVLNGAIVNHEKEDKKKSRKGILFSFLITMFALVGSAMTYWVYNHKPSGREAEQQLTAVVTTEPETKEEAVPEADQPVTDLAKEEPNQEAMTTSEVVRSQARLEPSVPVAREQQRVAKNKPPEVTNPAATETAKPFTVELAAAYSTLLTSGKAKMASADYAGARKDLTGAKEQKLTEEVVRLLITCDTREEEKRLTDRKAQYEEKMTFGKYKIVRKKSNGKYGAIDVNAEERIPCKYLSVGKADNGRAFEREDNLFDIYNADGALVSKGLTYY